MPAATTAGGSPAHCSLRRNSSPAVVVGACWAAKLRPLRFVASGAGLLALAVAAQELNTHTHAPIRRTDPPAVQPATLSKPAQLRPHRD